MKVLGIDPGYDRFGLAVVEKEGGIEKLLYSECIVTDRKTKLEERLFKISKGLEEAIKTFSPNRVAVEKLFFNKNERTAGAVAEARGVVLVKAAEFSLPVFEYTPSQVKVAVTGYGKSDKRQVIFMVSKLIAINKDIKFDDEFDAIAVALTCLASEH